MKVSIGLPTAPPGGTIGPDLLLAWAQAAEDAGFWSISLPDRIVWDNNETLLTLAFVLGATRELGVIADVVIAPVRETTLLAKQAATLDVLARGRLVLGVGIGGRADDYVATGHETARRGKRLEEQVLRLRELWGGAPVAGRRIGPPPCRSGGPPMLVGGGQRGIERAAACADGWSAAWPVGLTDQGILGFSGLGDEPRPLAQRLLELRTLWGEAGRAGRPYVLTALYAAVGPHAAEDADRHIDTWYGFSEKLKSYAHAGLAVGAPSIHRFLEGYEALGVAEVSLSSVSHDPAAVARLAGAVPPRFLR